MKQTFTCTLLCCVIVLLFSIKCFAQSVDKNAKGIWLYHVAPLDRPNPQPPTRNFDKKVYNYPGLKGVQLAFSWRKLQPLAPVDSAGNPNTNGGFNWNYLDSELIDVASHQNLSIGIMIWPGEDAPGWLYASPYNIGKCNTNWKDTGGVIYPKYFPDYFNSGYSQLWYAMIDSVMHHLNMGPDSDEPDGDDDNPVDFRNQLVFYQSSEGATGDLDPQRGTLITGSESYCTIDDSLWINQFVKPAWLYTNSILNNNKSNLPNVHLLLNTGDVTEMTTKDLNGNVSFNSLSDFSDSNSLFNWVTTNLPGAWRKATGLAHWHQLNYERFFKDGYNELSADSVNSEVLTRDECDQHNIAIPNSGSTYNFYTIAVSALHSGLDMNMVYYDQLYMNDSLLDPLDSITTDDTINTANKIVADFFNNNVDENPLTATHTFCALHDGLDASDTSRFPVANYNSGSNCIPSPAYKAPNRNFAPNDPFNLNCGSSRCIKIAQKKKKYGAVQNDAPAAQGAPIHQRNTAIDVNDAGWYIHKGNYERFLHQINPVIIQSVNDPYNSTSIGYWNKIYKDVNTTDTDYNNLIFGRFARGFDLATGKNAFYFDIEDTFLTTGAKCRIQNNQYVYAGIIKVTYLDSGGAKWKLYYDGMKADGSFLQKSFATITNGNTNIWKTIVFTIPCAARFKNGCLNQSDFYIKSTNSKNGVFALVEYITNKDSAVAMKPYTKTSNQLKENVYGNEAKLIITPNPSANSFFVRLDKEIEIESVFIYNSNGEEILNKRMKSKIAAIHKTELKWNHPGYYFVTVLYNGNKRASGKVLIFNE